MGRSEVMMVECSNKEKRNICRSKGGQGLASGLDVACRATRALQVEGRV